MFTFLTLTFNHSLYILDHLESIKFQVEKFSNKRPINLIIHDDCSTDDTVSLIKHWLDKNRGLFSNAKLLTEEKNIGIVESFILLVKDCQTEKFKLLAGDDLYYKNNCIDVGLDFDFVITPVISFSSDHSKIILPFNFIRHYGSKKEKISRHLSYRNIFHAPGIFFSKKLFTIELVHFLRKFKFIEDLTMWIYLFHISTESFSIHYSKEVKVLYRNDSGISTNSAHKFNSLFLKDKSIISQYLNKNFVLNQNYKFFEAIYVRIFYLFPFLFTSIKVSIYKYLKTEISSIKRNFIFFNGEG
jgi:hypothetical protein